MSDKRIRITGRVPEQISRRLRITAAWRGISASDLITEILAEHLPVLPAPSSWRELQDAEQTGRPRA